MAEVIFTGKPRLEFALFSCLGITEKDEDKAGIANKVLANYGSLALTTLDWEGGQKEYCFIMNEFPAVPAWKIGEGVFLGIDIIGMATKDFFRKVSAGEKRIKIKIVLFSHLGITDANTREIEAAKQIAKKIGIGMVNLAYEDDSWEYCYMSDELLLAPDRGESESTLQRVDAILMATEEFFAKSCQN